METPETKISKKKNPSRSWILMTAVLIVIISAFLFVKFNPAWVSANVPEGKDEQSTMLKRNAQPGINKQYKIIHIMSYHSPWKWTDDQFNGFKNALKDLNIQYKILQMDAKRKSDETWLQQITKETCKTINTWKPDLVYSNDDNAQQHITIKYIDSEIPMVFSAVNQDPQKYGFDGSKNITGVLERMHYVATIRLLKKLSPDVRKIAMLTDTGAMWPVMIERMKQQEAKFPGVEIVSYDIISTYEEFKQKVLQYQDNVDALGFFGVFEFKDENGNNVLLEDVLSWLRENNKLPDFSFWKDRVAKGTLCAVSVSGYAQGYQAGLLARSILVDGKSPAALPMKSTEKGTPVINLKTAQRLGINPSSDVLLTAEVIRNIETK